MFDVKYDGLAKKMLGGFKVYVWLFIGLFIFYLVLSPIVALRGNSGTIAIATVSYDGDMRVQIVMAALLILLFGVLCTLAGKRSLTAGKLILIIIIAGFVLRFGYMLNTPFYIRGHDVNTYDGFGHLAYIFRLFKLEGLPDDFSGQFYHPPFSHIAGAAVAKIYALITGSQDLDTIFEAAKLIPSFASCALLIVCSRLFDELNFSKRAKTVAMTVTAFHPTFILLSASINNDMLMIFFFMTAFLYTIRWYKDPTYKNILLLALSIGAAMSTKFSGALVAFFTAAVFLIVLVQKRKDTGTLFMQFAAFGAVCIPLGLWYHIRNLRLFGQALGYVAPISPQSSLYVGDIPFTERFLTFSVPDMLTRVYCNPYDDFRIWEYTVQCALFGEFTFSPKHNVFAAVLIVTSVLLIILSLSSMIWFLFFDKKKNRLAVLSFFTIWALLMLSFVFFNIKYPFGCTMDFRYIVPTVITGAVFLGLLSDKLRDTKTGKILLISLTILIAIFCLASVCFFIV